MDYMKSIAILSVKKKALCAAVLCIVLLIAVFCGVYFPVKATSSPKPLHTIVIDAGHGVMSS